jgi:hypothetical protein
MARAIAFTRRLGAHSADTVRAMVVIACATSLIVAGQALPF